jgi:hypothetical protein
MINSFGDGTGEGYEISIMLFIRKNYAHNVITLLVRKLGSYHIFEKNLKLSTVVSLFIHTP